jgi:hypothetical protein
VNRYSSRKFIAAMLSLLSCHWLILEGAISGDIYRTVVLGTVGAYLAANVAQKAVEGKS